MSTMARHLGRFRLGILLGLFLLMISGRSIWAQQSSSSQKIDVPAPERVMIETKDGVELRAEWFGGVVSKDTVPVILIHDWDGDRGDLLPLAKSLQSNFGHAVIVPDLRGHGESLNVSGATKELDRKRFRKNEIASMFEDIDSCRRFLQEKNNGGELNLDLLTVVAFGKLSVHAANWCIADWQWKPIGGVKQGQNVKALILISPRRRFKSLSLTQALKAPLFSRKYGDALPLLMEWGKTDAESAKDGAAIYKSLVKARNEPSEFADDDERWEKQTLFKVEYPVDAVAAELLKAQPNAVESDVATFIAKKVLAHKDDFGWQNRDPKK